MFRQPDVIFLQDRGAVSNGVHGKPVVCAKVIKAHCFVFDIFRLVAQLLVAVLFENALELRNDHIFLCFRELFYETDQAFTVKPVIAVQKAEISAGRGFDGCIYG